MQNVETMTKDELEKLEIEKEAELRLNEENLLQVEIANNNIGIKITELQLDRKRLANAITQGKSIKAKIQSELRCIKIHIWKRLRE